MKIKRASRWIHCSSHQPLKGMKQLSMQVRKPLARIGPDPIYSGIGMEKEASIPAPINSGQLILYGSAATSSSHVLDART
jgi:hypothetical protein